MSKSGSRKFAWAAVISSLPGFLPAQQVAIGNYPLPTASAAPSGITRSNGALWFTEFYAGKIGRITTAGKITEYLVKTPNSYPGGITTAPDGAIWFTELSGNKIGRIITGSLTEYSVPTANSYPAGITAGPDGALWFVENRGNKIGRVTNAGAITEYPLPTPASGASCITAGPDGALWFTEYNVGKIGRITTAGAVTEYALPHGKSGPTGITVGPDGALWFTEVLGNIGRITTSGMISEYPVPTAGNGPTGITVGPDGALWFTEFYGNKLGRITTAGAITEYPVPNTTHASKNGITVGPDEITVGPDGELWFSEFDGNNIGEAVFPTASLSVSPGSGFDGTKLTFTGNSFAPNENVQIYLNGVGSAVLTSGTADASGSFTATASEPASPYGARLFLGVGQSSGKLGAASFSIQPRLMLSPNSGPVGTTVMAEGIGFGSFESVNISWNGLLALGTAMTNINGTFSGAVTFTVPNARHTSDRVEALGVSSLAGADALFTVQ